MVVRKGFLSEPRKILDFPMLLFFTDDYITEILRKKWQLFSFCKHDHYWHTSSGIFLCAKLHALDILTWLIGHVVAEQSSKHYLELWAFVATSNIALVQDA